MSISDFPRVRNGFLIRLQPIPEKLGETKKDWGKKVHLFVPQGGIGIMPGVIHTSTLSVQRLF